MQTNTKSENGFHLLEICPQGGFQLRNPNPDFKDFLFTVRWEIRKSICKTVLVNNGVLFVNYACACKTAVLSVKIRFRISRISLAFYWEIRISDFANEHEIRKRISPPRNLSSGWISIKKSKCGFQGFPFYRSMGNPKLFSSTAVFFLLIMRARATPLFSALKSVFEFRVRLQIRNPDFKI